MNYLATPNKWLIAAFALFLVPTLSQAQDEQVIDNGTIVTAVFAGGQFGGDCSGGHTGFAFNGVGGGGFVLCGSGFLLATSPTNVIGTEDKYTGTANWAPGAWVAAGSFPYPDLEAGFSTSFDDSPDAGGVGIDVDFSVYFSNDDDIYEQFIVMEFDITNNSGGSLDLTPGQWMDWDVDPFALNDAEHDGTTSQRVFDTTGNIFEIFGHAVPGGMSGTGCTQGFGENDDVYYGTMTAFGASPCGPLDHRTSFGAGTRTVADGETTTATYCMIGALNVADFADQVALCVAATTVAIEPGPDGLPGTHNLSAVYPNPFNPQANFTLEVAEQQSVRIAVYDALGREVATLFNGTLTAGTEHAFTIDGAGLPSGVYMVRAVGEQFTDMRRVTLLK